MRDESDVLSTPLDSRRMGSGFRLRQRRNGRPEAVPASRALIWDACEIEDFRPSPSPEGVWGAYPLGFADWAIAALQCSPRDVLHVCSGALCANDVRGGVRVDLRGAARPDVRADGRALPFRDGAFAGVLIDPPYSVEYARELYDTDYPRPAHLLAEAARVTRAGGRIGFLHFLVASPPSGTKIVYRRAIMQGCGYRVRAFIVYQKSGPSLFESAAA